MLAKIFRKFNFLLEPRSLVRIINSILPVLWFLLIICLLCTVTYIYKAPLDYQQQDAVRIMYLHVPAAIMSLFCFSNIAVASFIYLVWRIKIYAEISYSLALSGLTFTTLTLVTGMLWGKPIWGVYWIWDARLTSELLLLFLYIGFIVIRNQDLYNNSFTVMASVFAILGSINVPIVHYSVQWWFTLHQGASITNLQFSNVDPLMLVPLLFAIIFFMLYTFLIVCYDLRAKLVMDRYALQ